MGFLILLVLQGLVFGFFCSYIAKEKNRDQSSWFWLGFCFSILAVFALIAIPKADNIESNAHSPFSPSESNIERNLEKDAYEGERNVASPSYQLFLTRQFNIEKNATLEKYVIGNDVFNTLEDSIQEADSRYGRKLNEINDAREKADRELRESNERATLENATRRERTESILVAQAQAFSKRLVISGVIIVFALMVIGVYIVMRKYDLAENQIDVYQSSTGVAFNPETGECNYTGRDVKGKVKGSSKMLRFYSNDTLESINDYYTNKMKSYGYTQTKKFELESKNYTSEYSLMGGEEKVLLSIEQNGGNFHVCYMVNYKKS